MSKRELLINTALTLFYNSGVHAVGINEVLKQSGVAKKTLYNHFKSKEALILACIEERDLRFMTWLSKQCCHKNTVVEFIDCLFNCLDDWINNRSTSLGNFNGCFFVNVAAEYSDENHLIHQQCLRHKQEIKKFFEEQLHYINGKHKVESFEKIESMVTLLMLLKEGSINCAFVLGDTSAAINAKEAALTLAST